MFIIGNFEINLMVRQKKIVLKKEILKKLPIIKKWKGVCPKLIKYHIYDTFVNMISFGNQNHTYWSTKSFLKS
jgi:hypothetical protein